MHAAPGAYSTLKTTTSLSPSADSSASRRLIIPVPLSSPPPHRVLTRRSPGRESVQPTAGAPGLSTELAEEGSDLWRNLPLEFADLARRDRLREDAVDRPKRPLGLARMHIEPGADVADEGVPVHQL